MTRNLALPIVIGLASLLPGAVASAAPLEPAACEQLRQNLGTLEKSGARNNFAKGAAWAKANLKPEQLQQIEQLIDTEAQFLFRCPQPKRQFDAATEAVLEHGTGSDPDPDAAKLEAEAPKTPVPVKKAAPRSKAPTASNSTGRGGDTGASSAEAETDSSQAEARRCLRTAVTAEVGTGAAGRRPCPVTLRPGHLRLNRASYSIMPPELSRDTVEKP